MNPLKTLIKNTTKSLLNTSYCLCIIICFVILGIYEINELLRAILFLLGVVMLVIYPMVFNYLMAATK